MNVCQVCKKNDPHADLVSVSGNRASENFVAHAHCALGELAYWEAVVAQIKLALRGVRGGQ